MTERVERFTPGEWVLSEDPGKNVNLPYSEICTIDECGEVIAQSLEGCSSANAALIAQAPNMYSAMQEFVDRVEAGEVRSKKTYAKFKSILAAARGEQ